MTVAERASQSGRVAPANVGSRSEPVMDTTEVRWFAPGPVPADILAWFAGQDSISAVDERCDTYLLHGIDGLGVKYRARRVLEVKQRHSIDGDIVLAPGLRAPMERWQKWRPEVLDDAWSARDVGRVDVHKAVIKSSFVQVDGDTVAAAPSNRRGIPACNVELASVSVAGVLTWTLALEGTGPTAVRGRVLQDAWSAMVAGSAPGPALVDHLDVAASYPRWLEHDLPLRLAR